MRPTAPENFDGDAATQTDLTQAQVDLSRLDRPDSQVYPWLILPPLNIPVIHY